ncbi:unnamed protein product [Prorocentrum cordatum]|uniref:PA domain-containing protein n=1 Tax=Prorocentrum cordatum TaxID=2364126 RepID=A0ABN9QMG6_9DINO|nr:unnamed protein product [Polarella glacialis]
MSSSGEPLLPLRGAGGEGARTAGSAVAGPAPRHAEAWTGGIMQLALDMALSFAFWKVLLFTECTRLQFWLATGAVVVAMVLWRVLLARHTSRDELLGKLPYTCGAVSQEGKVLYLVATLHVSPRAPRDVHAVVDAVGPQLVMIELDEERLNRFSTKDPPPPKDLQPLEILDASGAESWTVEAQRALWNGERANLLIDSEVVFDEEDQHGLRCQSEQLRGRLALVLRGGPEGVFAPFSLKAFRAARAGAEGVLVINNDGQGDRLPPFRLGAADLAGELRAAWAAGSCGFPPVPLLLLKRSDGERLSGIAPRSVPTKVSFKVLADSYPRRTLCRRLCQGCSAFFSGIGILYGIIGLLGVDVGAEFSAAEEAAEREGLPCVCVDVDMNRLWNRLGRSLLPTPRNLLNSSLSWVAFPRVLWAFLFPPRANVDVLGSVFLHVLSLPLRTWVAMALACVVGNFVTTNFLQALTALPERAAEKAGYVKEEDRDDVQTWILLLLEVLMLPQIYDAIAASRDEAMYQACVNPLPQQPS